MKRSATFLFRATGLYLSYKAKQVEISTSAFLGRWNDEQLRAAWKPVNDNGGRAVRAIAEDLQGYYLKSAQWLGARPDLVPSEWVAHLAPLQDRCPAMDVAEVRAVVEWELFGSGSGSGSGSGGSWQRGRREERLRGGGSGGAVPSFASTFERFDEVPLGSASIAQVHSARLTRSAARSAQRRLPQSKSKTSSRPLALFRPGFEREVVVKVQRPGSKTLVLSDLATLHSFAKLIGGDISWDVDMVMTEVMARVKEEFDFEAEARTQDSVHAMLSKPPPHRRLSHRLGVANRRLAGVFFTGAADSSTTVDSLAALTSFEGRAPLPPPRVLHRLGGGTRRRPLTVLPVLAFARNTVAGVGLGAPLWSLHAASLLAAHALTLGGLLTYRPCVAVPRSVPGLVTKSVLVMERCRGPTLSSLARMETAATDEGGPGDGETDEAGSKSGFGRGGGLSGWLVARRKRAVLRRCVGCLAEAYARMAFEAPGLVHGDPHPGNILLSVAGSSAASSSSSSEGGVRVGSKTVGLAGLLLAGLPFGGGGGSSSSSSSSSSGSGGSAPKKAGGGVSGSVGVGVSLVDWGQVTELGEGRRAALAQVVVAMTQGNPAPSQLEAASSPSMAQAQAVGFALEALGLEFDGRASSSSSSPLPPWSKEPPLRVCAASALATHFFDTRPVAAPFADHPLSPQHPLRTLRCSTFPSDLFLFVRAVQILKALSEEAGLVPTSTLSGSRSRGCTGGWSLAEAWRPHALGLLREREFVHRRG